MAPTGDVVTLRGDEMTPAQRAAVQAMMRGAATQLEREGHLETQRDSRLVSHFGVYKLAKARAAAAADLNTAAVSLFRAGEPNVQGIAIRVDFRSGGADWWLYSSIANSPLFQQSWGERLRMLVGKPDFSSIVIGADSEGKGGIMLGNFLNATISFLLVALAVYLFIVLPLKRYQESQKAKAAAAAAPAAPPEPSEEVKLLREIRDSLKK